MQDSDHDIPEIIFSDLCCEIELDGHMLTVEIFRLENEAGWHLEVENEFGTLYVHDDPFIADGLAWRAFQKTVDDEGLMAFMSKADRKKLSR